MWSENSNLKNKIFLCLFVIAPTIGDDASLQQQQLFYKTLYSDWVDGETSL